LIIRWSSSGSFLILVKMWVFKCVYAAAYGHSFCMLYCMERHVDMSTCLSTQYILSLLYRRIITYSKRSLGLRCVLLCTATALDRGFKSHFGHGYLSELRKTSARSFLLLLYNIRKFWPYVTGILSIVFGQIALRGPKTKEFLLSTYTKFRKSLHFSMKHIVLTEWFFMLDVYRIAVTCLYRCQFNTDSRWP
jgi:hypothetical protein